MNKLPPLDKTANPVVDVGNVTDTKVLDNAVIYSVNIEVYAGSYTWTMGVLVLSGCSINHVLDADA